MCVNTEEYGSFQENGFKEVADAALSTFSIDVDAVSYTHLDVYKRQEQIYKWRQDLATLVNIWLGEFSQAGNEESDFDKVTKVPTSSTMKPCACST